MTTAPILFFVFGFTWDGGVDGGEELLYCAF
jgi:hypothetical protein